MNKTQLTQTEIESLRIAIAEECEQIHYGLKKRGLWYRPKACGYTNRVEDAGRYTLDEAKEHEYLRGEEPVTIHKLPLPPYTTSLDAIQAAAMERFKDDLDIQEFGDTLANRRFELDVFTWQLTALDWCIAFARTAKIWNYKQP